MPFLSFLLGIITGILTGLIPGLHPNTVIFLLYPLYSYLSPIDFLSFIIGLSVSNTIFDFIPSIFVGIPEEDTLLSILPGHRFAIHGLGYYALKLTIFGAIISSLISITMIILLWSKMSSIYSFLKSEMHLILILLILLMLFKERRKFSSLLVLFLSGLLGIISLNSPIFNSLFVLFPILTGLFSTPTLLISLKSNTTIKNLEKEVKLKETIKGGFLGSISSFLVGFIPGIGSSQSALLIGKIFKMNLRDFLTAIGGINTAGITLSFLALYLIGRARSGASVAIENTFQNITFQTVLYFLGFSLVALGLSSILCLIIGKKITLLFEKINFRKMNLFLLILLFISSVITNGLFGILLFITSSSIGFLTIHLKVKRSFCMGVLLIPTTIFYLTS